MGPVVSVRNGGGDEDPSTESSGQDPVRPRLPDSLFYVGSVKKTAFEEGKGTLRPSWWRESVHTFECVSTRP